MERIRLSVRTNFVRNMNALVLTDCKEWNCVIQLLAHVPPLMSVCTHILREVLRFFCNMKNKSLRLSSLRLVDSAFQQVFTHTHKHCISTKTHVYARTHMWTQTTQAQMYRDTQRQTHEAMPIPRTPLQSLYIQNLKSASKHCSLSSKTGSLNAHELTLSHVDTEDLPIYDPKPFCFH